MNDAANGTQADEGRDGANGPHERLGPAGRISPDEKLITLTEATRHLPKVDGKKVSVCTLWRWCRKELRGAFLEYVRVGRKICTTREAMLRFFAELADLDERIDADRYAKPAARLLGHDRLLSRRWPSLSSRTPRRTGGVHRTPMAKFGGSSGAFRAMVADVLRRVRDDAFQAISPKGW